MRIVVTGGTGFIGKVLVERLVRENHSVVVLTRNIERAKKSIAAGAQLAGWDGKTIGEWAEHVDGAGAVINLAGESIGGKRWTPGQKKMIMGSRVDAARCVIAAIRRASRRPVVLVNSSAVGFYGDTGDEELTETHKRGSGFLPDVVERWENEVREAESLGVRVVMLRTGVVLGNDGGALDRFLLPFRLFLGGPLGSGRQWFPWIHRDDVVSVMLHALRGTTISGPVNVVAPEQVTMKGFCAALGKALGRPSWAPVPSFLLRIVLGEMAEMVLGSQRVVPTKLTEVGYPFLYPKLDRAFANLFSSS